MLFRVLPIIAVVSLTVGCAVNAAAQAESPLLTEARRAFQAGDRDQAIRIATQMIEEAPKDPNNYFLRGRFYELTGQREKALADFSKLLEVSPFASEALYHRAVLHFLLGRIPESVADFAKFLEAQPDRMPALWQRGIALYYAGKFEEGRKQFETHRTVNPGDVENSVWHFLCVARLRGVEAAREELLPAPGDPRIPMREVYELFAGTGSPEKVLERAETTPLNAALLPLQRLYAHLYIALHYEALGNETKRREHLQKAVDADLKNEYMWEVARVHLELLKSGKLK